MAHRFIQRERIQFSDTDMAGIVHFANFFRLMERAEHAFYRSLGLSVVGQLDCGTEYGWPRVHASCDFKRPLKFEEEVDIEVLVEHMGNKSIRYLFRFWKLDGQLAATGKFAIACVQRAEGGAGFRPCEIPDEIRQKIEVAPEALLADPA